MTLGHPDLEQKRPNQVTSDQPIEVVAVDFRREVRPERARALAALLFGGSDDPGPEAA